MAQVPATIDLTKYVETRIFGERPHIRGRRVPIAMITYSAHSEKWNGEELAYQFTLSEAQVLAALLYYQEHKAEIDAQEQAEQAQMDEMYRLYGKD